MNTDFWLEKVDGNVAPDLETTRILTEGGWTVIRFWEHEPSSDAAPRVLQIVRPLPDAMPG